MDTTTRILWSGLTGRTGMEAIKIAKDMADASIIAGISRQNMGEVLSVNGVQLNGIEWLRYNTKMLGSQGLISAAESLDIDIIVDFSHPDAFNKVLELAVRTEKPIVSGTSGLSDRQMAMLYDATNRIPVFRGGNFRFKVKKFIDECVELAQREQGGRLDLYENFYKGKSLPSETSRVIQRRIMDATGRTVEVHSSDTFGKNNLVCDWELQVHRDTSPANVHQEKVHCRTIGLDELAHDVLEIAKVMKDKPIKKGEFYDLDEIWNDIPAEAKTTL